MTEVDISAAAVENTRRNALRHRVADRVRTLRSDLFAALDPQDRYGTSPTWTPNCCAWAASTSPSCR
ncbi:hypothetical protein [Streptomyces melanogenes]|uniref:hypothetical protein n=1 Tax=Streptomyces melanogenes TaxID=67326 RepID=UPI00378914AC